VKIGDFEVHPAAEVFPLLEGPEFDALCKDIEEHGVREPIVLIQVGEEKQLLDGRNRIRGADRVGVSVETVMYEGDDPLGYVLSANLHRRHLDESQRAMVGARIKVYLEAEAKKRQLAGLKKGDEAPVPANFPEREKGDARDQAGAAVSVSGRSISKAEKVIAGGCDELQAAVNQKKLSVDVAEKIAQRPVKEQKQILKKIEQNPKQSAKSVLRQHDKDKIIAKIKKEPQPPPEGPFRVIVADPPWPYEKRPDDGTQRGQTPYPSMSIDEICKLAEMLDGFVGEDGDCILWLWVTNAHLADGTAAGVLDAWGFNGKTVLTWKKPKMGTGDWLRGITEHCILAVRGKPVVDLDNETTYMEAKVREHSRKPEEFYKMVDKLCPGSKLEMFATEPRDGWQMWAPGNWREEAAEE